MNEKKNPRLTANAQTLRRNMTDEERRLWYTFLKGLPLTVRRQKVIGKYIVDFCIPEKQIIIELDGTQHYQEPGMHADRVRDAELTALGYKVLRYSNADIRQRFRSVCQDIWSHLELGE